MEPRLYVTFLPNRLKRIREFHYGSTLPTLPTNVTWRWKSSITHLPTYLQLRTHTGPV